MSEFDIWLSMNLEELEIEESVFLPYISSFMAGEESDEAKNELLIDLLSDILDDEATAENKANEILLKWKNCATRVDTVADMNDNVVAKVDINKNMNRSKEKTANLVTGKVEESKVEVTCRSSDEESNEVFLGSDHSISESAPKKAFEMGVQLKDASTAKEEVQQGIVYTKTTTKNVLNCQEIEEVSDVFAAMDVREKVKVLEQAKQKSLGDFMMDVKPRQRQGKTKKKSKSAGVE
eukprot:GFUD01027043.1.p1 GENE.GFUD01027043.1~~GFUD01027043.1.p1  ORF type:complete len:236 (+),score=83.15 GFUD01027043.1:46-753(+)